MYRTLGARRVGVEDIGAVLDQHVIYDNRYDTLSLLWDDKTKSFVVIISGTLSIRQLD